MKIAQLVQTDGMEILVESVNSLKTKLAAARRNSPEEIELTIQLQDAQRALNNAMIRKQDRKRQREQVKSDQEFPGAVTELESRNEADRARKHAAILVECSTARENVRRLLQTLENGNAAIENAAAGLRNAENNFTTVRKSKPDPSSYPSNASVKKWNGNVESAEVSLKQARAAMRKANEQRDEAMRDLTSAQEHLAAVSFRERMLRPRIEAPLTNRAELHPAQHILA